MFEAELDYHHFELYIEVALRVLKQLTICNPREFVTLTETWKKLDIIDGFSFFITNWIICKI